MLPAMYAACLHCHRSLGRNEAIEHFFIGKRLAFDSFKGRLWVVCSQCGRWNLTPIEERWEAVEDCEKLFRAQKLRAQTENIGLVRVGDGTVLIRIGKPLRPEFAAWRYGPVFQRRMRNRIAIAAGGSALVVATGAFTIGAGVVGFGGLLVGLSLIGSGTEVRRERRGSAAIGTTHVVGADGKVLGVTRRNLEHTSLRIDDDGSIRLDLRHSCGRQELTGDRASRALSSVLVEANRGGAMGWAVREAVELITNAGDPTRAAAIVAREAARRSIGFEERAAAVARGPRGRSLTEALRAQLELQRRTQQKWWEPNGVPPRNPGALHHLPAVYRLALEMSVHERAEQHALDEELATLERDWREAEEIAAIADGELTPLTRRTSP
jgi:hypothetical protein